MNENFNEEIKRVDKIDQTEDKLITIDPEKVDQYTETYIEKVEQLLTALENSDLDKGQKTQVKKEVLEMLGMIIGPEDLVQQEKTFRDKIDKFLKATAPDQNPEKKDTPLGLETLQKIIGGIKTYDADLAALKSAEQELSSGELEQKTAQEYSRILQTAQRQLDLFSAQMQAEQKNLETLNGILNTENLAQGLQLNSSWFTDTTKDISQALHLREMAEKKAESVRENIETLETQMKKTVGLIFVCAYLLAKKTNKPTDSILISAFNTLGEELPPQIKDAVNEARSRAAAGQGITSFEKYYHSGDYAAALENLAQLNQKNNLEIKLTGAYGTSRNYSPGEISDAYKQSTGPRADDSKRLANAIIRRSPIVGEKIKEGYTLLVFPGVTVDQNNPEKTLYKQGAYSELCLAKKLPDGSISLFVMPLNVHAQEEKQQNFTLTAEAISKSEKDEKLVEENVGLVMSKMKSFKLLGNAADVVERKFEPMKTLYIAAVQGKAPQDFVEKMKVRASEIQKDNPTTLLKENLANVKRDLDILKKIPVGQRGKFELQIDQMTKAYDNILKIVENDTINDFCKKILSDDFSEDTKLKWLLNDGFVFFATIAVAVAFTILTFGAGGIVVASAAGALGGIMGREIGSLVIGRDTELTATLKGEKYFNDATSEFEQLGIEDLVTRYGSNFAHQFAMTLATVGLGRFLNTHLLKFAETYKNNPGIQGAFAKLSERVFALGPKEVDMLKNNKSVAAFFEDLVHETGEEMSEEALSIGIQQVGGAYGDLIGLYTAMRGGKIKQTFGSHDFNHAGFDLDGGQLVSDYAISATPEQLAALSKKIKATFEKDGYTVSVNPDGSIICSKPSEGAEGKSVALRFRAEVKNDKTQGEPGEESEAPETTASTWDYSDPKVFRAKVAEMKDDLKAGKISKDSYNFMVKGARRQRYLDLMGNIMRNAEALMITNPDLSTEEIFSSLVSHPTNKMQPSSWQKKILRKAIGEYVRQRAEILPRMKALETYEGQKRFLEDIGATDVDPNDLEFDLSNPVTIGVGFRKDPDYDRFLTEGVNDATTKGRLHGAGGAYFPRRQFQDPKLDRKVFIYRPGLDDLSIRVHELQHRLFRDFYDHLLYESERDYSSRLRPILNSGRPYDEIISMLEAGGLVDFSGYNEQYEKQTMVDDLVLLEDAKFNLKDETLAYLKVGVFQFNEPSLMNSKIADIRFIGTISRVNLRRTYDLLVYELQRAQEVGLNPREIYAKLSGAETIADLIEGLKQMLPAETGQEGKLAETRAKLLEKERELLSKAGLDGEVDPYSGLPLPVGWRITMLEAMVKDRGMYEAQCRRVAARLAKIDPAYVYDLELTVGPDGRTETWKEKMRGYERFSTWQILNKTNSKLVRRYNDVIGGKSDEAREDDFHKLAHHLDVIAEFYPEIVRRIASIGEIEERVVSISEMLSMTSSYYAQAVALKQENQANLNPDDSNDGAVRRAALETSNQPTVTIEDRIAQFTSLPRPSDDYSMTNIDVSGPDVVQARETVEDFIGQQDNRLIKVGIGQAVFADSNREMVTTNMWGCLAVFIKGPQGNALIHMTPSTSLGYSIPGEKVGQRVITHNHLKETMAIITPQLQKLGPINELEITIVGDQESQPRAEIKNVIEAFKASGVQNVKAETIFLYDSLVGFLPQKPDDLLVMSRDPSNKKGPPLISWVGLGANRPSTETLPVVNPEIQSNLAIDDSDGGIARRAALESSLQAAGLLDAGQRLDEEDWKIIWKMHQLGGKGEENLLEKGAIALEYGIANKNPAELEKWKKIYHHALERGFAGVSSEMLSSVLGKGSSFLKNILGSFGVKPENSRDYSRQEVFQARLAELQADLRESRIDMGTYRVMLDSLNRQRYLDLMGNIIANAEALMVTEPDLSAREIFDRLVNNPSNNMMPSSWQIQILTEAINKYVKQRAEMKSRIEDLKTYDGRKKFLMDIGALGVDPNDVEFYLDNPISIGVGFKNDADYEGFAAKDVQEHDKETIERSVNSGGLYFPWSDFKDPVLNGKVFMYRVRPGAITTIRHELRHRMFKDFYDHALYNDNHRQSNALASILRSRSSYAEMVKMLEQAELVDFSDCKGEEEKRQKVRDLVGLEGIKRNLKDETLAYLAGDRFQFNEDPLMYDQISKIKFTNLTSLIELRRTFDALMYELKRVQDAGYKPQEIYAKLSGRETIGDLIEGLRDFVPSNAKDEAKLIALMNKLSEEERRFFAVYGFEKDVDPFTGLPFATGEKTQILEALIQDRMVNKAEFKYIQAELAKYDAQFAREIETRVFDQEGKYMTWKERRIAARENFVLYVLKDLNPELAKEYARGAFPVHARNGGHKYFTDIAIFLDEIAKYDQLLAREIANKKNPDGSTMSVKDLHELVIKKHDEILIIQSNLSIEDSDGGVARRAALEESLREQGLLQASEQLSDDDWAVIWKMHELGGSGEENLLEKGAIALEYGIAHKNPAELEKWKKIYHHALKMGYAGGIVPGGYAVLGKAVGAFRRLAFSPRVKSPENPTYKKNRELALSILSAQLLEFENRKFTEFSALVQLFNHKNSESFPAYAFTVIADRKEGVVAFNAEGKLQVFTHEEFGKNRNNFFANNVENLNGVRADSEALIRLAKSDHQIPSYQNPLAEAFKSDPFEAVIGENNAVFVPENRVVIVRYFLGGNFKVIPIETISEEGLNMALNQTQAPDPNKTPVERPVVVEAPKGTANQKDLPPAEIASEQNPQRTEHPDVMIIYEAFKDATESSFVENMTRAIQAVEKNETDLDELGQVVKRLKERDPKAIELLKNSDLARLLRTGVIYGMIRGHKLEFQNQLDKKVIAYQGTPIGRGGLAIVSNIAFVVEDDNQLQFGVIKEPADRSNDKIMHYFRREIDSQRKMLDFKHENIIRTLQLGEDAIILETAEGAFDLLQGLNFYTDEGTLIRATQKMPPASYLAAIQDAIRGLKAIHATDLYHGDIKPGNVLLMKTANGRSLAKIIDNDLKEFQDVYTNKLRTPLYSFGPEKIAPANKELRKQGLTREERSAFLAKAQDAYAVAVMITEAMESFELDGHDISFFKNSDFHKYLKMVLEDPSIAGKEDTLDRLNQGIETLIPQLI